MTIINMDEYRQVQELKSEDYGMKTIARMTGLPLHAVKRYYRSSPEQIEALAAWLKSQPKESPKRCYRPCERAEAWRRVSEGVRTGLTLPVIAEITGFSLGRVRSLRYTPVDTYLEWKRTCKEVTACSTNSQNTTHEY